MKERNNFRGWDTGCKMQSCVGGIELVNWKVQGCIHADKQAQEPWENGHK